MSEHRASSNAALLLYTVLTLLALLAWDAAGQDLASARWFGGTHGFPLREHWFLVQVLHEDTRRLGWALVLMLALGVWWPWGILRRVDRLARLQCALSALLSLAVIGLGKGISATSCPWDLAEFGGVARYASHWALGVLDGGGGHCFPAGHASAGFAFVGGYFALRSGALGAARGWLAASLLAGLVLGMAQQVRGAHFMSHTLWTGWLCWAVGFACDMAVAAVRARRPSFLATQPPPAAVGTAAVSPPRRS